MIGHLLAMDMFSHPFQKEHSYDKHKDVMKKLKFISKIEPGDRINVNSISTSNNSLFSSIYRSIFKESRSKTYQFLNDVIDRSFELIVLYKDSDKMSDRITCSHILEDLHHSINGLKNLQITYNDDRSFNCDIDTLIGSIYARLAECHENKKLFTSEDHSKRLQRILFPHNDLKSKEEEDEKKDYNEHEPLDKTQAIVANVDNLKFDKIKLVPTPQNEPQKVEENKDSEPVLTESGLFPATFEHRKRNDKKYSK
jgi:hypothetical protein